MASAVARRMLQLRDLADARGTESPAERLLPDLFGQRQAPGRELDQLGVADPLDSRMFDGETDRSSHDRPCQRPAADLINADQRRTGGPGGAFVEQEVRGHGRR